MGRQLGMFRKPCVSCNMAGSVPAADPFLSRYPFPILFLMTFFFPSAIPNWYYQNGGPSSGGCWLGGPWPRGGWEDHLKEDSAFLAVWEEGGTRPCQPRKGAP